MSVGKFFSIVLKVHAYGGWTKERVGSKDFIPKGAPMLMKEKLSGSTNNSKIETILVTATNVCDCL
jgi:hypothetical protein